MSTDSRIHGLYAQAILAPELRSSSVAAALVVSLDGQILAVNDALLDLVGRRATELVRRDARKILFADSAGWDAFSAAGRDAAGAVTINVKTGDGRIVVLRGDVEPIGKVGRQPSLRGIFVDATAGKHLECALARAARMEAVASLTSGIAHDFSNLLTVLVGNLYLMSEGLRDRPPLYQRAKLTRDAAKRGTALIKHLLAFARNEWTETEGIDPRTVVSKLEPLLRRAVGSRIALEMRVADDTFPVGGNAAQLESAIVNLVINARDAIRESGKIEVHIGNIVVDERRAGLYGVGTGEYVSVSVMDDGCGIPEDLIGRVFEPFFSTKGPDKGTGLGLSMVRLFAVQAGGTVLLRSDPGKGTKVFILLPRAAEATNATTVDTAPLASLPPGNERILVFAEDFEIRSTVEQVLGVLGYTVVLSSEYNEALRRLATSRPDLVLVDIPSTTRSSGLKLLESLMASRRNVPIVAMRDTAVLYHRGFTTLQKPFDIASLATTVRNVLDRDAR